MNTTTGTGTTIDGSSYTAWKIIMPMCVRDMRILNVYMRKAKDETLFSQRDRIRHGAGRSIEPDSRRFPCGRYSRVHCTLNVGMIHMGIKEREKIWKSLGGTRAEYYYSLASSRRCKL